MKQAQKVIKYLAIALAMSIIVSIFSLIYSLFNTVESKVGDLKETEVSSEIDTLNIDLTSSTLILKEGPKLKVETNNKYITPRSKNNELIIEEKGHNPIHTTDNTKVVIYVPKNTFFENVAITTGAGNITINSLNTNELDLALGAGKLTINSLTVKDSANIESGAGEVLINEANINNLDLDVGVGKFTINSKLTGSSEIDAGIGELNINLLDEEENYIIYVEKGIGSININKEEFKTETTYGTGKNKIDIDGGIGSIDIKFKGV